MAFGSPSRAVLLSIVLPGLGQWASGQRAKGFAYASSAVGCGVLFVIATIGPAHMRSWLTQLMLGATYPLIWIPAVVDAARGDAPAMPSLATHAWYPVLMVLMIGAMAVPLVWQCPRLSRGAKVVWSTIGIVNSLLFLVVLAVLGPLLQQWLDAVSQATTPWP